ncbi:MBL fold metallo-hydrolase [Helicobacter sp. 23-1044]
MELLSKAFGIYETNCYILRTKMGEFIIDAGVDSAKWVCENVRKPLAILNTHGHFDHIWCNAELKKLLGVPIYCPKGDAFMLKSDCFDLGLTPCAADFEVEPNEIFRFGDIEVEFMHFAGHTPGCSMIKISGGNLSLGMQFAPFSHKTSLDEPQVLSRSFHAKTAQSHTANTSIVIRDANQSAKNPSLLENERSEFSWQSTIKSNPCDSTESRPLRGAKNRIEGCSSATADFLLEADKRGTPPKSEKRELLGTQLNSRGERGRGAALLREKTNESNKQNNETIADSANQIKIAESCTKTQNLKMDCHDLTSSNLAMTENKLDSANRTNITESSEIYIFSGDFIFYRTIGRSDFPYSSPSDMKDSLQRFGKIPYNATLYPGHGQSTTIKDEQKNLPFYLRGLA